MKLTYIRLLTDNYRACFRFYRDVMGFEITWGDEEGAYAEFRASDGVSVALNRPEVMAGLVDEASCSEDNAVLIFAVEDLAASVQTLKQRGAKFVAEVQDRPSWGVRTAHLRDPAGNLLELNTPLKQAI